MIGAAPSFWGAKYFRDQSNYHLTEDAPEEMKEEFEEFFADWDLGQYEHPEMKNPTYIWTGKIGDRGKSSRRGFDVFMKNPYYREQYENAPTEKLKRYFELEWDSSPFVVDEDYDSSKNDEELRSLRLSKAEVEYLAKYAVGGAEKAYFKKVLASFDRD